MKEKQSRVHSDADSEYRSTIFLMDPSRVVKKRGGSDTVDINTIFFL